MMNKSDSDQWTLALWTVLAAMFFIALVIIFLNYSNGNIDRWKADMTREAQIVPTLSANR